MRLALTGASGLVGRFMLAESRAAGDRVIVLGRAPLAGADWQDWRLGDMPDLSGVEAVVHCALAHVPGKYRGGEGDDPEGFRRANLDGTLALIRAAEAAGVARFVLLSSRAVYGDAAGPLTEDMVCRPTSLYGEVKLRAEEALARAGFCGVALRATGVYGAPEPGLPHKWQDLFAAFARGEAIAPRVGTEVHGADLAVAVRLALTSLPGGVWNVSDILLDRADLLARWARISGVRGRVPERAAGPVAEMDCARLRGMGWRPGGWARLEATLAEMGSARIG